MLSCKDVTRKISQAQDRRLTFRERLSIRLHLLICYACRRFVKQVTILTAVSQRLLSDDSKSGAVDTLTDSARHRIRDRLQESVDRHDGKE